MSVIEDLLQYFPPKRVRLSACSLCQLSCPACDTHFKSDKKSLLDLGYSRASVLGRGCLRAKDFKLFLKKNPYIKRIELAHSGEIFLNPELSEIVRHAFDKKVILTAGTGVNLNNITEAMCEDLVRFCFHSLTVAIDGADDYVYGLYRKGGSFTRVIENVKLINHYKKKYRSKFPVLEWQFILFGHNEHQIAQARQKAAVLGMNFKVKLNARENFSPLRDVARVRKETGLAILSRAEYHHKQGKVLALPCHELWTAPQINWDGRLMGCFSNLFKDMGNVFQTGLPRLLRSSDYRGMKKVALGATDAAPDIPCYFCRVYNHESTREERRYSTLEGILKSKKRNL